MMSNPVQEFKEYAVRASFHYADDTCEEWGQAKDCENKAMDIYHAHPECQDAMNLIGKEQLWASDFKRRSSSK
jgi:hypothetical protein